MGSQVHPVNVQHGAEPQNGKPLTVRPMGDLQARYYIRLDVADNPGVLAQIAQVLGDGQISIAAVLQRDTNPETESAEIVICWQSVTAFEPRPGAAWQPATLFDPAIPVVGCIN